MKIEKIEWDSKFFGYPIGKICLFNNQEYDVNRIISESAKYRLTYLFSDQEISVSDNRIKLVDTKITWEKDITFSSGTITREKFNNLIHSYDQLLYLGYLSGTYSRFRLDENFQNNEFEKLYKEWIDKSIRGKFDDSVFIKSHKNQLEGLVTLRKSNNLAQIGLIAVHPNSQGKGVATELIQVANDFTFDNNLKTLIVATQYDNKPAMRLYEKSGFHIRSKEYIYHVWNE